MLKVDKGVLVVPRCCVCAVYVINCIKSLVRRRTYKQNFNCKRNLDIFAGTRQFLGYMSDIGWMDIKGYNLEADHFITLRNTCVDIFLM